MKRFWWALLPAVMLLWWQAGYGLHTSFFPDDVMNMLGAFRLSWWHVATDLLWPGSGAYRPAGAFFYRSLYDIFGLTPFPFHLCAFLIQTANLAVLWIYTLRKTGQVEAAMAASMLFSYHAYLSDIYASTGTIYDQICFLFFFGALLMRDRKGAVMSLIGFVVCTVLALSSKEIAVLLPAALLLEDLLEGGRNRIDWRAIILASVLSAISLARGFVVMGEASQFDAYTPRLSWDRATSNLAHYFGLLFLRPAALDADKALTICGLLVLLAIAIRKRTVTLGLGLFGLGLIPALLVPQRSLYMLYVPMSGLALALGTAIAVGVSKIPLRPAIRLAGLAVVLGAAVVQFHAAFRENALVWVHREERLIADFAGAMRQAYPSLPKGAKILFVDDTFTPDDYNIELTMPLIYRDTTLHIQRVKRLGRAPDLAAFDYVLRYENRRIVTVSRPPSGTAAP